MEFDSDSKTSAASLFLDGLCLELNSDSFYGGIIIGERSESALFSCASYSSCSLFHAAELEY